MAKNVYKLVLFCHSMKVFFFTFEALRIDSQKTNTYVHVPYDVRHLSTAFSS